MFRLLPIMNYWWWNISFLIKCVALLYQREGFFFHLMYLCVVLCCGRRTELVISEKEIKKKYCTWREVPKRLHTDIDVDSDIGKISHFLRFIVAWRASIKETVSLCHSEGVITGPTRECYETTKTSMVEITKLMYFEKKIFLKRKHFFLI